MTEQRKITDALNDTVTKALRELSTVLQSKVTAITGNTISVLPTGGKTVGGQNVAYPEFKEVIPLVLYGGGSYDIYPIAVGDSALLLVADGSLDEWYAGDDASVPLDTRSHDYTDCIAIVGIRPLASALPIPETSIKRNGDSDVIGDYDHTGDYKLTGELMHIGDTVRTGKLTHVGDVERTGDTDQTGNVTISLTINVKTVIAEEMTLAGTDMVVFKDSHQHTFGTNPADGNTGPPI